ncbi:hypothetical protein D3C79_1109440 [compost metagenome]
MFEGVGLPTKGRQAASAIQASEQTGSSVTQEIERALTEVLAKAGPKVQRF